jgi:asparagine synthetase B (glutamine-hydrolysing)
MEELKNAIIEAVMSCVVESNALLFSGGVDSTFIAKILKENEVEFKCYTAGFPGAEDIEYAKRVAYDLGLDLKIVEIKDLEENLKKIIEVIGMKNPVMVSVAIPFYFACSIIQEKNLFSGLGSEEIFAGYRMHKMLLPDYEAIRKLSLKRLEEIKETDIKRDQRIADHFGLKLCKPYLNPNVVDIAMKTPGHYKVTRERDKIILREIAYDMGVPKYVAWRKKRAAQYGSSSMKELKKLARSKGHKYLKDYLEIF